MQFNEKQIDAILAGLRLLGDALDHNKVAPDDGSIGDILTNGGNHEGLTSDEIDTLCREINCGTLDHVTVNLNIFDDEGNVVDGTTADLTVDQLSDIVDHASQLALIRRSAKLSSGDTEAVLSELEEALSAAGVIDAVSEASNNSIAARTSSDTLVCAPHD